MNDSSAAVIDISKDNRTGNEANHSALRNVRARIIEIDTQKANGNTASGAEPGQSQVVPEEPFEALAQQGKVIEPPFEMLTLAMLCEHSSELNQVIEAMETNVEGYGHRFISRLKKDDTKEDGKDDTVSQAAAAERARLTNFFTYATEESFVNFRRRLRRDLEMTGNCYFEVLRDTAGEIQAFTHMPGYQVRMGKLDEDAFLVDKKVLELQADGSVELKKVKEYKRFRRYVQSKAIHRRMLHTIEGHKVRWFKQFGDPRNLHKETGDFEEPGKPVEEAKRATEIIHIKLYSARTPYGLPRYIGNLLSIFGDRAAEEINYITFRNNNIPSMVVCVSNGQLTEGTIARIQDFVRSQVQGSDNYSKFLIIEGEPFGEEGEDGGQVKVDVKPLTKDQHRDALFQNYSANNQDKIRRAFRMPPIFVGRSDDYTRSTAEASRRLADEQIFAPERNEFDELINRLIFPEMGILYHKFKSNSPNTTDNSQLVKILAGAEKTGGMTPRIARHVLQEVLSQDLPEFPKDFPSDVPFSLTMAEAVKSETDPSEPGQTVTALKKKTNAATIEILKSLNILGDDGELDLGIDEDASIQSITKKLMSLNKAAEMVWRSQGGLSEASTTDET